ncbi:MAG TPA: MGMT family protein, partial [Patescibacteria group bacterium]|nr:MGMT family protein [Patescibacteria group bacterium]
MSIKKSKFSQKVIAIVDKIKPGKTLTYKEVAARAGNPKAARAVGNILNSYYK